MMTEALRDKSVWIEFLAAAGSAGDLPLASDPVDAVQSLLHKWGQYLSGPERFATLFIRFALTANPQLRQVVRAAYDEFRNRSQA